MSVEFEPVIGLEVHAQLKTNSKIFCSCPVDFGGQPNDQVCPVCSGMPGVLPVINKKAVELAIRAGLALNCEIATVTKFDRKNYFYPDLPKGYQISQYDKPICSSGHLVINGKTIRINRAHLEEDAGKLVHAGAAGLHGSEYSLVDLNRCSVPLIEIVSEPDISNPDEARLYLTELRNILRCLEVSDGNLEEGSFRCDANVSLRPKGSETLGTKAEIKNMNSFRAVQRAVTYEIERQTKLLSDGQRVVQETRLWNEKDGCTYSMRSKEEAHDYRYFPEPDLVPLEIARTWVESIKSKLPELPEQKRQRYTEALGLKSEDAFVITENKEMSRIFDQAIELGAQPRGIAVALVGPVSAYLNEKQIDLNATKLTAATLVDLVDAQLTGVLGSTNAKVVLVELLDSGGLVRDIIEKKGLAQLSDEGSLRQSISETIAKFPKQLDEFRSGKTKVRQFFFGEIMKLTKGKANPEVTNRLLDELLASSTDVG